MCKFIFKYLIKDKIRLTFFNKLIFFRLLKKLLKKHHLAENYLYEYDAKTIQKTLNFMIKKQGCIDSMWLQRGLIQENKNFSDESKLAHGSSTIIKENNGKNYLSNDDLNLLEKIDPIKTKIIKQTHQKLEEIYKKALCNKNLIYQPEELTKIGQILSYSVNLNPKLTFHRGNIKQTLKLYFKRTGQNFKKIGKTNIFIFDEKIDLLIKGEEFIFNLKTAKAIEKKVGGNFFILNPFSKEYKAIQTKNILNTGVYDLPHLGHASKIKNLKTFIDKNGKIIIGLTNNKNVNELKNKQVVFSAEQRKMILNSLNFADRIIIEPKQSKIFKEFYSYVALPFYSKIVYNTKKLLKK